MNISRSHSMLDQLSRKQVDQVSSTKMIREIMNKVLSAAKIQDLNVQENVLEAVSEEGLFEASRLANPILPQYHPKQLIEMLNAGKIKRVKAVLLHVLRALKHRRVSVPNPLSRAASVRKMTRADGSSSRDNSIDPSMQRRSSVVQMIPMEDTNPDYDEIDTIAPLPFSQTYDTLFNDDASDEDLDEMLDDIVQNEGSQRPRPSRTRHSSGTSELVPANTNTTKVSSTFTNRHSRLLTELLTHTHLPGLSSVDQMHLLAIADTISHFSSNAILDKLTHANAVKPLIDIGPSGFRSKDLRRLKSSKFSLQSTTMASTLGDSSAAGYASATMGIETVDECGLRFLMAMKQHEYLLLCLPLKQRKHLKARGISTAQLIWAFHSDTEMELLSAIPCCQKSQETWEELRSFGVAWWLKNTTTLRICVEKMAKSAFTQNQDPMDASLFYLALKKKNVLMHLFKTVSNGRMYDFFREDFTQDRWKRAALKNAFTLQSKQRYHHAAAFFLLGGSLKDAIQTILSRLNDLQLAMVILRLHESDPEKQSELINELLCREIFGCEAETIRKLQSNGEDANLVSMLPHASRDPFERSMAFWLIKEYAHAASTLVEEASKDNIMQSGGFTEYGTLSDIFNFYTFLRKHPLVVRRRLTDAGVDFKGTDQFLAFAKQLEGRVTPSERRLYFRTASAHMASGCPLLALDVLSRLPNQISSFLSAMRDSASNLSFVNVASEQNATALPCNPSKPEDLDWAASPTRVVLNDDLELKWSDDEEKEETAQTEDVQQKDPASKAQDSKLPASSVTDFISQHLRFFAVLRIMMDELATLASGFEIDGGQLRFELFKWLESECEVLHEVCDFHPNVALNNTDFSILADSEQLIGAENSDAEKELPLHESLRLDRIDLKQKLKNTIRRRNWLDSHQKLIRTLTSYCALHSAQNYRLTSIQMELLLLLLEVQRDAGKVRYVNEPVPDIHSFPLLVSSISSCRMFVLSLSILYKTNVSIFC
uniref:RAVE complex protein Rav1 C-terminal domain-containing protein n=1 Tax=Ditylenchus dipsaci TaxID=166011 RepID=A0A915EBL8_9BILA